jgi:putative addiction module killer protein
MRVEILEYLELSGRSPFARWFRIEQGNLANAKSVGRGVQEYRIDFGPGYRLYFGRDGVALIILLGGGTKQRQQQDIVTAQARWQDYRMRKERSR